MAVASIRRIPHDVDWHIVWVHDRITKATPNIDIAEPLSHRLTVYRFPNRCFLGDLKPAITGSLLSAST